MTLQAGTNTLSFAIPTGATAGPNLDSIEIVLPGTEPDATADADGILAFSGPAAPLDKSAAASIAFNVAGRDDDIYKAEISFDGGTTRTTVYPKANGDFVYNGSALPFGTSTATLIVTDATLNEARTTTSVTIGGTIGTLVPLTIQAEDFTVNDTTGTGSDLTQPRKVGALGTGYSPPTREVNIDGLWDGFTGTGYMDMGSATGDAVNFAVNIPTAGTYTLSFRYSNGGGGDNAPRPMTLTAGGQTQTLNFTGTGVGGWDNWAVVTITVELAAGRNIISLANSNGQGPNIDSVTIAAVEEEPENTPPVLADGIIDDAQVVEGSLFSLDLDTVFDDADGDTLTFTSTELPTWLTLAPNGVLSGTPPSGAAGSSTQITVTARDPAGAVVSDTFQLTVAAADVNEAPEVANEVTDQTGQVGEPLTITLPDNIFTDPDGDELEITLTGLPPGLTFDAESGTITGTPTTAGSFALTLTATDGTNAPVSDTFNLDIGPAEADENGAPFVANAFADQTGQVGEALAIALPDNAFTDPDNDALTLSLTGLPQGVTYNAETRTLSGTPTTAGTYQLTVTATDTAGATATDTFALTIEAEDQEPAAPVRIEAEAFERRTGFTFETIAGTSGGQVIRLPSGQSGTTSTDLADVGVAAGTYDVRIAYLDENDSNIGASLYVDGVKVGDWRFDQATPGNGTQIA
ncbi:putative Ig domain-containing protein, partial [Belnapia moabensis]|uniref:putative Ig domain-containing protein n=1 Tax=Belnapia moabensis TaxID=365533 RepID=UPI001FE203CC